MSIKSKIIKSYEHSFYRVKDLFKTILLAVDERFCAKKIDADYSNSIIFMLACDYNNVGDILIRISQEKYLKENFKNKKIITIDYGETSKYLRDIKKNASKETIIVLTGGGDVDDRYIRIERLRDRIIRTLKRNDCKIISFPQTIDYSDSGNGRYYLRKAQRAYSTNKNFIFAAREKKSYEFAKKAFVDTKIIFVPDIVLSNPGYFANKKRTGAGFLVRKDVEKSLDDNTLSKIVSELEKKGLDIALNDMTVEKFEKSHIEEYASEKITFAQSKKVIITDRLHGMILCYITNTPCLVFKNTNHKIVETYNNWLKNTQNFIVLEESSDIEVIKSDIEKLLSVNTIKKTNLRKKFANLTEAIQ